MSVFSRAWVLGTLSILSAAACDSSNDDPSPPSNSAGTGGAHAGAGGAAGSGDDVREVTIRWKPRVQDQDFSCDREYDDLGSSHVRGAPADFRFYIQDLALIDRAGHEVPVTLRERSPWQANATALLDFEDQNGSCGQGTPETNDYVVGSVPAGDYTGVAFTNGVPEELNHQDPIQNPAPLQVTDLTWGWLTGFKFFVAEMHAVAGEDAPAAGVALLHLGSRSCSGDPKTQTSCKQPNRNRVRLDDFDPTRDVIIADLAAVFSGTDLSADNQCHSAGDSCAPMFERVGVDWTTGEKLTEQSVYRVERAEGGE